MKYSRDLIEILDSREWERKLNFVAKYNNSWLIYSSPLKGYDTKSFFAVRYEEGNDEIAIQTMHLSAEAVYQTACFKR